MRRSTVRAALLAVVLSSVTLMSGMGSSRAAPAERALQERAARHARVVEHWTPARRRAAIPRDLVRDARGQGYLRLPNGALEPHGRRVADKTGTITPNAKPGGDTTGPLISGLNPGAGATIGASHTFQATVTDASGLQSVTFNVRKQGSAAQSFTAAPSAGNVWTAALSGFTDGSWSWSVVARDKAKPTNTSTSPTVGFQVSTGGGGGGGDTVENARWTQGGAVQTAAGRIYFEMPGNSRRTRWVGYVCSGTAVNDGGVNGRSVILTASHCVYDDAHKAFARNVLFIPNQDDTTGSGTDLNCNNDPVGCWTPSFGVVDRNWTTRTFPDNIAWDYAFYVVNDTGAHTGTGNHGALDVAVATLPVSFVAPVFNDGAVGAASPDFTHALGYSYSDDPNFMYCAEDMTTEGAVNWWLPSCGLSGGSSGGPWVQDMTSSGTGDIVSVNSWGYTNQPGMAGPKLAGTSASCVFSEAKFDQPALPAADGEEGLVVTCP